MNSEAINTSRILQRETILSGKYRIDGVLGEGSFGITYAAWDSIIQRKVAIKEYFPAEWATRNTISERESSIRITILTGEYESNQYKKGLERFAREAENLAKLQKLPGIVNVSDFFYENETAYMVMEYIEGMTLEEYLRNQGGKLPLEDVLNLLFPLMESLKEVHKAGIVHRDISPDNIMVSTDGHLKLIDFGAARYVGGNDEKSLTVILKHGYAPEEQYRTNGKQGPWTDIYAFCAVLYRMLTGKVPPEASARIIGDEVLEAELHEGIEIPAYVVKAIQKGMAISAEKRYRDIKDLDTALKNQRKNSGFLWAFLGVFITLICVALFWGTTRDKEKKTFEQDKQSVEEIFEDDTAEGENSPSTTTSSASEEELLVEPEYITKLRAYFNENYKECYGKVYFVDLTEDGADELLFVHWKTDPKEAQITVLYYDGESVYSILDEYLQIEYVECNEFGTELYYDFSQGRDYYLVKEDGKYYLEYREWQDSVERTYDYIDVVAAKRILFNTQNIPETIDIQRDKETGIILLDSSHKRCIGFEVPSNMEIDNYQQVICLKNKMEEAFFIVEDEKCAIIADTYFNSEGNECYYYLALNRDYRDLYTGLKMINVWGSDGENRQIIETIGDENYGLDAQEIKCDIYRFGKNAHFFVEVWHTGRHWEQHKYGYEDGQYRIIDNDMHFWMDEEGKVWSDVLVDVETIEGENIGEYYDSVEIFYIEGEYVSYGREKIEVSQLAGFRNYEEMLSEIKKKLLKLDWIYYVTGVGGNDFNAESAELKEVYISGNDRIYINYCLNGVMSNYEGESIVTVWAHAELRIVEDEMEILEVDFGRISYIEDTELPVHYGAGQELLPDVESITEETTTDENVFTEEEMLEMIRTSSGHDITAYHYDDYNSDGSYEIFAYIQYPTEAESSGYLSTFDGEFEEWYGNCEVWFSNGVFTERQTLLEGTFFLDEEYYKYFNIFTIYQFGKQKVLLINTDNGGPDGGISEYFTYDKGIIELPIAYSLHEEDSQVFYDAWTTSEDIFIYNGWEFYPLNSLSYPIFYLDGKVLEMASVEVDRPEVEAVYGSDIFNEVESKIFELSVLASYQDGGTVKVENISFDNVLYNDMGFYYLNYTAQVRAEYYEYDFLNYAAEPTVTYGNEIFEQSAHAVLKIKDGVLEIQEVNFGEYKEMSGVWEEVIYSKNPFQ